MSRRLVLVPRWHQPVVSALVQVQNRAVWREVSFLPSSFVQNFIEAGEAPGTVSVDFDSDGLGTVVFASATIITDAVSVTGLATVNFSSGALAQVDGDSDGHGTVNFVGGVAATTIQTEFHPVGLASVNGVGGLAQGGIYTVTGVATVNAVSGATARSVFGVAGQANVFGNGKDANVVVSSNFPYVTVLRRRRRGHINA